jgi:hypothetical protein
MEQQTPYNFISILREFSNKNLKTFIDLMHKIKINYESLNDNKDRLSIILQKLQTNIGSSKDLKEITVKIRETFEMILIGSPSQIVNLIGVFLLVFQLLVGLINIASSILILNNVKKGYVKYLGHSSWCLSTFSLMIMAIVLLIIYALGSGVTNLGYIIQEKIENPSESDSEYVKCFNSFNITKVYKDMGEDSPILQNLDELTKAIFAMNNYDETFSLMTLFGILNDFQNILNDPTITIVGDDNKYTYQQSEDILNKITNFRSDLPYMIMNDCSSPLSIQMREKTSDCTFPLIEAFNITEKNTSKKACLKVSGVTKQNVEQLFKSILMKCKYSSGKYLDADYNTLYEEVENIHNILYNYLYEYQKFKEYVTIDIIIEYDKINIILIFF